MHGEVSLRKRFAYGLHYCLYVAVSAVAEDCQEKAPTVHEWHKDHVLSGQIFPSRMCRHGLQALAISGHGLQTIASSYQRR